MIKIKNMIPAGDGCGWGICGSYLAHHLPEFCEIVDLVSEADVLLLPVNNENWDVCPEHQWAWDIAMSCHIPIVGYGFHEMSRRGTEQIQWLPRHYTALACGSEWMRSWVYSALQGVADDFQLSIVIQGVDQERFFYRPDSKPKELENRFVVLMAGKCEFRKSQDVVLEAFRRFKKSVPEALLLMNIDSPWAFTYMSMQDSPYKFDLDLVQVPSGQIFVAGVKTELVAPEDQMQLRETDDNGNTNWRMLRNAEMPGLYSAADIAVFPSRVEAAQSNNAVETARMGTPLILVDAHGMGDLVDEISGYKGVYIAKHDNVQYPQNNPVTTIASPCVDSIVDCLYREYKNRTSESDREILSNKMSGWTWQKTARDLVSLCEKVVS